MTDQEGRYRQLAQRSLKLIDDKLKQLEGTNCGHAFKKGDRVEGVMSDRRGTVQSDVGPKGLDGADVLWDDGETTRVWRLSIRHLGVLDRLEEETR